MAVGLGVSVPDNHSVLSPPEEPVPITKPLPKFEELKLKLCLLQFLCGLLRLLLVGHLSGYTPILANSSVKTLHNLISPAFRQALRTALQPSWVIQTPHCFIPSYTCEM